MRASAPASLISILGKDVSNVFTNAGLRAPLIVWLPVRLSLVTVRDDQIRYCPPGGVQAPVQGGE